MSQPQNPLLSEIKERRCVGFGQFLISVGGFVRKHGILIALAAVALSFRLFFLSHQSLWLDEGYSIWVASHPVAEILRLLIGDTHPPLFYTALHFLLKGGKGEAYLRFPSAILGTINALLVWRLARRTLGEKIGLLSGFFWAISYFALGNEMQVRMYTQATCFSLASSVFLWEVYVSPGIKNRILYFVFALLAVYSHYYTGLVILGHMLFLVCKRRFREAFYLSSSLLIAYIPWFPYFFTQYATGASELLPRLSLYECLYMVTMFLGLYDFFPQLVWLMFFSILGGGIFLYGAVKTAQSRKTEAWFFLLILFSSGIVPMVITETTSRHIFFPRYLMIFAPYFFVLFFYGIARISSAALFGLISLAAAFCEIIFPIYRSPLSFHQHAILGALTSVPILLIWGNWSLGKRKLLDHLPGAPALLLFLCFLINPALWYLFQTGPGFQRQNWRAAAEILRGKYRKGDVVLIGQRMCVYPLWYYLRDRFPLHVERSGKPEISPLEAAKWTRMSETNHPPIIWFSLNGGESIPVLKRVVPRAGRIWLILCQYDMVDPGRVSERWLNAHARILQVVVARSIAKVDRIEIYLLKPR